MSSPWIAYNELAWTEAWLADPADYEEEVSYYVEQILTHSDPPAKTLLHLGSGAYPMQVFVGQRPVEG